MPTTQTHTIHTARDRLKVHVVAEIIAAFEEAGSALDRVDWGRVDDAIRRCQALIDDAFVVADGAQLADAVARLRASTERLDATSARLRASVRTMKEWK
jgi:predicted RecB family endonuclease